MTERQIQLSGSERYVQCGFDPANIGDSIAEQTCWTPLKKGGSNFYTKKLVRINDSRVEFRATTGLVLFYFLFIFGGLSSIVYFFTTKGAPVFMLLMGFVFVILGGGMVYIDTEPIVFDKARKNITRERISNETAMGFMDIGIILFVRLISMIIPGVGRITRETSNKGIKFEFEFNSKGSLDSLEIEKIHALQLVSEYIPGKKGYYTYELNAVLDDNNRINIIKHGNQKRLQEDAKILSEFLERPLWDAT